jgi:hypothetical protein
MSDTTTRMYQIESSQECLGDALAKINTNFKALDILTCNLEHTVSNFSNNLTTIREVSSFVETAFDYVLKNSNTFNTVYNVTKELAKYWLGVQYTIYVEPHYLSPYIINLPEIIRVSVLNKSYQANLFPEYSIINVVKTNFNRKEWPSTTVTLAAVSAVNQVKELSHSILRYFNYNNTWNYYETIECPTAPAPEIKEDKSSVLIISAHNIKHLEGFKSIDYTALLSTSLGFINLPSQDFFSWEWYLNDSETYNLPVTGVSIVPGAGSSVIGEVRGVVSPITAVSSVRVTVGLNTFTETPSFSTLYVAGYNYTDNVLRSALTSIEIGDMPDRSIFDVYFTVKSAGVLLGDSDYESITIESTTPTTPTTYVCEPFIQTSPLTEQYDILWSFTTSTGTLTSNKRTETFTLPDAGTGFITLCAHSAFSLAWGDTHSVSRTVRVNSIPFQTLPEFITFPRYTFTPHLTELNITNFKTFVSAPTAYGYRTSQQEEFCVSAVPGYDVYKWQVGDYVYRTTKNVDYINIPYSEDYTTPDGAIVRLTAHNSFFPESISSNTYTTTTGFANRPITATTTKTSLDPFKRNPRGVSYDEVVLEYDLNIFDIDLAKENQIISTQKLFFRTPATPVRILGGDITYTLATDHWLATSKTSAVDGMFGVFCISPGDPFVPYSVDAKTTTVLNLSACGDIVVQIPSETGEWLPEIQRVCYAPLRPEFRNSATPTQTPSNTPTPTPTPTITRTPTPTPTPTITPTPSTNIIHSCGELLAGAGTGIFTYTIFVTNRTGPVTLNYDTFNIPDRFEIEYDSAVVANTGFVGDLSYNGDLNSLGLPNVVGPGKGSISFTKTTATDTLKVMVYAPLAGTKWEFVVDCPPGAVPGGGGGGGGGGTGTPGDPFCSIDMITFLNNSGWDGDPASLTPAFTVTIQDVDIGCCPNIMNTLNWGTLDPSTFTITLRIVANRNMGLRFNPTEPWPFVNITAGLGTGVTVTISGFGFAVISGITVDALPGSTGGGTLVLGGTCV